MRNGRFFGDAPKVEPKPDFDVKTLYANTGKLALENDFGSVRICHAHGLNGRIPAAAAAEGVDQTFLKVKAFPNEDALECLVSTVPIEIDDKWAADAMVYINCMRRLRPMRNARKLVMP